MITYRFNAACSEKKGQNNEECISTQEFFDHTEKAVESKDGVSKRVGTFDESGNRTSVYLLDQKGRLKADSEGIAKTKMEYDRNCLLKNAKNSDCISLLEYFGADGKPTEKNGMAGKKVKYNENGNMIEFEIFRIDGTRAEDPVHKIAQSKYSGYDENCLKMKPEKDCFLEKTFFDRNDLPRERNDGIARIANVFDQNGFKVKTMFFDRKGFFADSHESGFSIVHYHYDQECADNFKIPDRCLRGLAYFNKDLKPALPTRGYSESYVTRSFYERFAEYKADLDSFGNTVSEIYYNDRSEIRSIIRQDTRLFRQDGRLKRKRVPDESLHSAKTTDYERLIPSRDPGKDGILYNENSEQKYHLLIKNSGTKDGSSFIYIVFDRFYRPVEVQFRRY